MVHCAYTNNLKNSLNMGSFRVSTPKNLVQVKVFWAIPAMQGNTLVASEDFAFTANYIITLNRDGNSHFYDAHRDFFLMLSTVTMS